MIKICDPTEKCVITDPRSLFRFNEYLSNLTNNFRIFIKISICGMI